MPSGSPTGVTVNTMWSVVGVQTGPTVALTGIETVPPASTVPVDPLIGPPIQPTSSVMV